MDNPDQFEVVDDPVALFETLGGLHDVYILAFAVNVEARTMTLAVNDALFNFETFAGHVTLPCELQFVGVTNLQTNVTLNDGICIYDAVVTKFEHQYKLAIGLSDGWAEGTITSIEIVFDRLKVSRLQTLLAALKQIEST